jgi:hypothetical protein
VLAYDYPILGLFWTFLWIFLWVAWLFILFKVIFDIFRSRDLGGWGKALWVIFVILIPWLGVLVYLIARGRDMGERDMQEAQASRQAFDSYVRETAASSTSTADELSKLADLQARGIISQTEFEQQKAKILG